MCKNHIFKRRFEKITINFNTVHKYENLIRNLCLNDAGDNIEFRIVVITRTKYFSVKYDWENSTHLINSLQEKCTQSFRNHIFLNYIIFRLDID